MGNGEQVAGIAKGWLEPNPWLGPIILYYLVSIF